MMIKVTGLQLFRATASIGREIQKVQMTDRRNAFYPADFHIGQASSFPKKQRLSRKFIYRKSPRIFFNSEQM
jgi:hypothetical protein